MATNDRNAQHDRSNDLNRNENLKGEAGKTPASDSQTWDKKQQERSGEGKAPGTTNPSATQGFEANRDRNKYDDKDQRSQNQNRSDSDRKSGI